MESQSLIDVRAIPDQSTRSVIRQPDQAQSPPDLLSPINLAAPGSANQSDSVTPRVDAPLLPLNISPTRQSGAPRSPPSADSGIAERRSRSPVIHSQSEHPHAPPDPPPENRPPPNPYRPRPRQPPRRPTLLPTQSGVPTSTLGLTHLQSPQRSRSRSRSRSSSGSQSSSTSTQAVRSTLHIQAHNHSPSPGSGSERSTTPTQRSTRLLSRSQAHTTPTHTTNLQPTGFRTPQSRPVLTTFSTTPLGSPPRRLFNPSDVSIQVQHQPQPPPDDPALSQRRFPDQEGIVSISPFYVHPSQRAEGSSRGGQAAQYDSRFRSNPHDDNMFDNVSFCSFHCTNILTASPGHDTGRWCSFYDVPPIARNESKHCWSPV